MMGCGASKSDQIDQSAITIKQTPVSVNRNDIPAIKSHKEDRNIQPVQSEVQAGNKDNVRDIIYRLSNQCTNLVTCILTSFSSCLYLTYIRSYMMKK